ncbi:serine/threonine-protein kinase [Streptomyces sp. NRRL F-5123]|uniref:serine/threonine-protein kinase n=1 Tax=Streptomyces sp. NRRL F-5123 TaxID=1463856 RepID=UPI0006944C36|nr:serine/threonine-protein kinase [Streptomyces sp. NRRL F-5123]
MERLEAGDPRSIGGYPLFARLGAGGMGQVFLARTPAGRALALKTVRPEFALDSGFGARFAQEIRNADRVRSPWTVAVVDFSPPGSGPQWLATEYVPAPSLADRVAAHGPLPATGVVALAAELCGALRTVHEAGLAHRDVKPSNVLLAGRRPLLIDFGIARAADDTRHTSTGGMIGSPGYMAPEQATAGSAAEPGDLFALASVLVYAATGHGPFQHPGEEVSAPALLYRVVHEDADLGGVPAELLPMVRACLAKSPADRPDARGAAELLPGGGATGDWPAAVPELAADLAAREAQTRAALGAAPAADLGPSPYGPATTAYPPRPAPHTPPHPQPVAHPPVAGPQLTGPQLTGPQHPYGSFPSSPVVPARRRLSGPVLAAAGGVVAVAAVLAVVLSQYAGGSGSGGDGGSGGDTGGKGAGTSSSGPSTPVAAANELPTAWVGTWYGEGPGSYSQGSSTVKVTLTLRGGKRGSTVGRQVSNIPVPDSGVDNGCTEDLRLTGVQGDMITFQAVTSVPTDPDSDLHCADGRVYTLSMTDATHLQLAPGSTAPGSPTTLRKKD